MNDTKLNENLTQVVAVGGILLMRTQHWRDEVTKNAGILSKGGYFKDERSQGGRAEGGVREMWSVLVAMMS